jgi:myo-inositol-1(or 4)-monophosphatase
VSPSPEPEVEPAGNQAQRRALAAQLLDVATAAAATAADLVQAQSGRRRTSIATKSSPTDLVSEVDRAAEQAVVAAIVARRPDDAVLAEEGTSRTGTTGVRWVIDPLDGTTNYLFGVPAYAVSVAAEVDGRSVAGVVIDPSRGEMWQATAGGGATLNDTPLRLPDDPPEVATSLVATGFSYLPERRAYQARVVSHVLPRVRDIRRFGAAALDLCWVAGGRVSAFYELGLQPWDLAAGVLIATEAGAETATLADGTVVVAAPGLLAPLRRLIEDGAAS